MTVQRRHGQPMRIWKVKTVIDSRGNQTRLPYADGPHQIIGWVFPQRSARADVPGQQQINVIRIGVPADLQGVSLWSRVEIGGQVYDVVSPPAYHHGTRHTRHWSLDLRERPSVDRAEGPP